MKKNSSESLQSLVKELDKSSNKGYSKDERIYYPQRDKEGNGYAIIRFLPEGENFNLPYVKTFSHGFKDVGGWLIDECPTTIEQKCPVCEANGELWNSGTEENKKIASRRKRKTKYYSNILVVNDPANPENNGKNFLFAYGTKIFNKIELAARPKFEHEKPIDVFHLLEGADFELKITKVDGNTNYDSSRFKDPSPVSESEEEMERIWNGMYDLSEFKDPKRFKSHEDLLKRLAKVTNTSLKQTTAEDIDTQESVMEIADKVEAPKESTKTEEVSIDDFENPEDFFNSI